MFCENCGINLREGLVIGTWLENIKGALRRYGVAPSMVARRVEGPFLEVFQTCATVLSGVKVGGGVLTPTHGLKDVRANPETGEITAKQDPRHTWPKSRTVRVFVQPGTGKQRGVAVICTERYRTAGAVTTDIANRVAEAIRAQLVTLPLTIRHNP